MGRVYRYRGPRVPLYAEATKRRVLDVLNGEPVRWSVLRGRVPDMPEGTFKGVLSALTAEQRISCGGTEQGRLYAAL